MRRTILLLALVLAACGNNEAPTVPLGPQTMTGTLQRVELSLMRRGTHVLLQNGKPTAYVQSRSGSLLAAEGYSVVISGTLEANTDRDGLPILSAANVRILVPALKQVALPRHKIRLSVPVAWKSQDAVSPAPVSAALTHFTDPSLAVDAGMVLLTISSVSGSLLPTGTGMTLGGQPAVHATDPQTGAESYVMMRGGIITILTPSSRLSTEHPALLRDMLRSVAFIGSAAAGMSSQAAAASAGSSVATKPCGGPAGILCPSGSICIITDTANAIGYCKALK